MLDHQLVLVLEGCRFDLLLCANHNVHVLQDGSDGQAKGANVVPLVGPKIQVHENLGTCPTCAFGRKKSRTSAWFLGQVCACKFKCQRFLNWGGQDVIDSQLDVCRVLTIEDQRKPIGRLDSKQH